MLRHRYLLPIVAQMLSVTHSAHAQSIESGVQYRGPTTLSAPDYGATFELPAGWSGVLPPDGELFVMQSATLAGYMFAGIEELTLSQAQTLMGEPIDLGDVVLTPSGEVHAEGSVLTGNYTISGSQSPLVGHVTTVVGDHGWGVFVIAAGTNEQIVPLRDVAATIIRSVRLSPPVSTAGPANATNDWSQQLRGRKLSHFFTRSGYTEEDYIWLCTDGRFFRSLNSGGFGGGASGAFESKNAGRWEASGNGSTATLTLVFNDGTTTSFALSIQDEKLFLDGSRYFREATDCR